MAPEYHDEARALAQDPFTFRPSRVWRRAIAGVVWVRVLGCRSEWRFAVHVLRFGEWMQRVKGDDQNGKTRARWSRCSEELLRRGECKDLKEVEERRCAAKANQSDKQKERTFQHCPELRFFACAPRYKLDTQTPQDTARRLCRCTSTAALDLPRQSVARQFPAFLNQSDDRPKSTARWK
jgi:hypothetical protein